MRVIYAEALITRLSSDEATRKKMYSKPVEKEGGGGEKSQ